MFTVTATLSAYRGSHYLVPAMLAERFVLLLGAANLAAYPAGAALLATPDLGSVAATQTAIGALQARGLSTGYADYWTSYPITYQSEEQIVVAPDLLVFLARTHRPK